MNRKEIFSLLILIVVVSYGAYKYFTREYTEIRSKYLLDTIVEISATSKSKNVSSEIEKTFNFIQDLKVNSTNTIRPACWQRSIAARKSIL